jgi:hypothetical protein
MKKGIWALIIILLIAAGAAYYFLKPASLPVSIENRQTLEDVCISMSKQMLSDTSSLAAKTIEECTQMGLMRFSCEAALRNDQTYLASGQLEKDCAELALSEAVLESNDKRNCNKLENPVLVQECITILS